MVTPTTTGLFSYPFVVYPQTCLFSYPFGVNPQTHMSLFYPFVVNPPKKTCLFSYPFVVNSKNNMSLFLSLCGLPPKQHVSFLIPVWFTPKTTCLFFTPLWLTQKTTCLFSYPFVVYSNNNMSLLLSLCYSLKDKNWDYLIRLSSQCLLKSPWNKIICQPNKLNLCISQAYQLNMIQYCT